MLLPLSASSARPNVTARNTAGVTAPKSQIQNGVTLEGVLLIKQYKQL